MKKTAFLFALLVLLGFPAALAHSDEFGEATSMHFMHRGALKFPVWTYYAEIVEHLVMVVVVAIALYAVYEMSEIAKTQSVATSVHSKLAISEHAQMSKKQGFFEHTQKSKIFDEPKVFDTFSRFHIEKKGVLNLFVYGFLFIGIGELLTLLHHFLIYPLGVLNAVFNHGLLVIGIVFLGIGFVKLIRYEEGKKRKK